MLPRALIAALFSVALCAEMGADELVGRAERGLASAVHFFDEQVSVEGGYLWQYSSDLQLREGERRAGNLTAWVQPPGTPSVGMALVEAYRLCGRAYLLSAARRSAHALVRGQLRSGGWDYKIEFDDKERLRYAYRTDPPRKGTRNTTTLDDDTTQAALRFLMEIDKTLKSQDFAIHEAAMFALGQLLAAQYPNGAWPQRFDRPPNPERFPIKKAGYPDSWPRKHPDRDYRGHYTFNDNTTGDMIATMFLAAQIYQDATYRTAAIHGGDFILLAQMPDPQPAWAQQYNAQMHPVWARRFEPPAVTGGESQGILRTLLFVYRETGDTKYLDPVPRAIAYLRRSALADGRLARFYELKTNRPLYFTKDYQLTYASDDLPTHYAFMAANGLNQIEKENKRLRDSPPAEIKRTERPAPPRLTDSLITGVESVLSAQDDRGAWVEPGRLRYHGDDEPTRRIIRTSTFATNIRVLARYLAAAENDGGRG